jgi:cycloartenol synthase
MGIEFRFCVPNMCGWVQNTTGGWATYENTRSYAWLERINPAETFGDIMIDYDYVECSSACITALAAFRKRHPQHRTKRIAKAISRGKRFLLSIQRPDGSWCVILAP